MSVRSTILFLGSFLTVSLISALQPPFLIQESLAQGPPIVVESADPSLGEQETLNLNVTIRGKGFREDSTAHFLVSGTENPGGVTVNNTLFIDSRTVLANIDIDSAATLGSFDIEVRSNGRRGKGVDLFTVVQKGGNNSSTTVPFEVRYVENESLFNFLPDRQGFFNSGGCPLVDDDGDPETPSVLDCSYRDGENGFVIDFDPATGEWRQVQQYDRDLADIFPGETLHYRYFETDIESQVLGDPATPDDDLCPDLVVPDIGWTLGGSYTGEMYQGIRFSLWVSGWPDIDGGATARAYIRGMVGVATSVPMDFDGDGDYDQVLDSVNPGWDLYWDADNFSVTEVDGVFMVEGKRAMLVERRPNKDGTMGTGPSKECGLVDAYFRLLATRLQ